MASDDACASPYEEAGKDTQAGVRACGTRSKFGSAHEAEDAYPSFSCTQTQQKGRR